jgi:serine/threonine-protein phosphatase 5
LKRLGDVNEMIVDDSYTGPRIVDNQITLEFVIEMLAWLKDQKLLHRKYALQIMIAANEIFLAQATIVDVKIPKTGKLTVCGDIHGQFYDVLNVFEKNGSFD